MHGSLRLLEPTPDRATPGACFVLALPAGLLDDDDER
jgi:hypothetical protein